jgi:16S rRNA (cytosine1402-N4)-methyltransferase
MTTPSAAIEKHVPVLVPEVIAALAPRDGAVYVDGTFGAGGYSAALLAAARCRVCGIDRDPRAIAAGATLVAKHSGRLELFSGRFGDMERLLTARGVTLVDGVTLDIGVSSPQIDEPARGFSFRFDGPLDMRMGDDGPTAAEIVNTTDEATLADIIDRYGEERFARRIAKAIVAARLEQPITRTLQLAEIVRKVVRRTGDGIDPATRTFQALRIYVNDEIGELRRGLAAAERLLAPGGRLAVVSFHSLEDREVKSFLKNRSGAEGGVSRHMPTAARTRTPSFTMLTRRAVRPADAELARNPRARSARLRAAERTAAPAWAEAA